MTRYYAYKSVAQESKERRAEELKPRLNAAFKAMRQAGLLARQNFLCCGGCAGYELATMATARKDAGKADPKGVVFYHAQDAADFREGLNFHLGFGQIGTQKYGDLGLPTVEVGQLVAGILTANAVPFAWDGDPMTRIEILVEAPAAV